MDNTWSIDRFENNLAILENINTKEKKEVNINLLPKNIKEGSIISYKDNTYLLKINEEEKRRQQILEKFQKLRKQ